MVTGQQVGLFSGPAYTIYKALTAVKLARELTARGIPAVPVFWLATEDHDFAEVNHCWVFDAAHQPIEAGDSAARRPPASRWAKSARAIRRSHELRALRCGFPFGADVAAWWPRRYMPGATMGAGVRRTAAAAA